VSNGGYPVFIGFVISSYLEQSSFITIRVSQEKVHYMFPAKKGKNIGFLTDFS
jgi:hypothetical protein